MSSDRRPGGPILEDPNRLLFSTLPRQVNRSPELVAASRYDAGPSGMLSAAVAVVQALGRAEGAALYVVHDDGPALAACTVDASRLVQVLELCRGVLQSGCMTSGFVHGAGRSDSIGNLTCTALALCRRGCVVGVLYLEGLPHMSDRVKALVQRCAEVIGGMLELPPGLAGADAGPGPRCSGQDVKGRVDDR